VTQWNRIGFEGTTPFLNGSTHSPVSRTIEATCVSRASEEPPIELRFRNGAKRRTKTTAPPKASATGEREIEEREIEEREIGERTGDDTGLLLMGGSGSTV
jgi:hypothetical protein